MFANSSKMKYFNPRSPYGERRLHLLEEFLNINFNPRSPYGERHSLQQASHDSKNFNPRSPYGERPAKLNAEKNREMISIHAPHTGSDFARGLRRTRAS